MKQQLIDRLRVACTELGIDPALVSVGYPEDSAHGDYTTNIAMISAKAQGLNPRTLAQKIAALSGPDHLSWLEGVSVAGPGFVNYKVKDSALAAAAIAAAARASGPQAAEKNETAQRENVLIEYTDPNTFKVFHIGHLMSNAIGESLSRLIEHGGASVTRICYPSDIGLHIAKSLWALRRHTDEMPADDAPIAERTSFLGRMYVEGTNAYEADPAAKTAIDVLNKVVYERSDPEIDALYRKGRQWSLDHFEILYRTLGTKFDEQIFESEMAPVGLGIVREHSSAQNIAAAAVFEVSDGAMVYKGGPHTRVFINSQGLPTYEAKEMGLNITKFKRHPDTDRSIVITASEQNDYFKVVLHALSAIDPAIGAKTHHIGHGMMRFASGKMSSRTGRVVTAEDLLGEISEMARAKMSGRGLAESEIVDASTLIAVAAIKYTILRSSVGSDIIFDSANSISFDGDSGPYLQYSAVRARSVLAKAGIDTRNNIPSTESGIPVFPQHVGALERLIVRFADVTERAAAELAPQQIAGYLIDLAGAFNSYYGNNIILDSTDPLSPYRIALTRSFLAIMSRGLWLLGIQVPDRM